MQRANHRVEAILILYRTVFKKMEAHADTADYFENLILEVEKCPWIWDSSRYDYRDIQKRKNSWQSIGVILGTTADETQKIWKTIRDKFTREIREKEKPSGSSRENPRTWKYMAMLSFLRSSIKHRKQTGNFIPARTESPQSQIWEPDDSPDSPLAQEMLELEFDKTSEEQQSLLCTASEVLSPASTASVTSIPESPNIGMNKKRKHGVERQLANILNNASTSLENISKRPRLNEMDADVNYCLSLVGQFSEFTNQQKALAKIKIQQLFYDIKYGK